MPLAADRWFRMIDHDEQTRMWTSPKRHRVLAAGRGSGKTESAARIIIGGDDHHRGAMCPPSVPDPLFVIAAPTRDQVKSIWWKKLKAMVPTELMAREPRETELSIDLRTGATIRLVGLDRPERVEGVAIDGLIVDEYAEVKADAWESSLEPACNRRGRPGWAMFIGRPKGRGHFYRRWADAKTADNWDSFHWTSEPVLGASALAEIEKTCDPLTFRQEYLADWVTFDGLAYYRWDPNVHYRALEYNPDIPLILCFDFNVDPGTAAILQEQVHKHEATGDLAVTTTCAIGEVHIPGDSNTPRVCNALSERWKHHRGDVVIYGDPSGGARKTSQTSGTDWEIIRQHMRLTFGDRVRMRVARAAPPVRDRINAMNTRLRDTAGGVRFLADPRKVPNIIRDFEGVFVLKGGSGEVDKRGAESNGLSHLSDAIGYYIHEVHPVGGRVSGVY